MTGRRVDVAAAELARLRAIDARAQWAATRPMPETSRGGAAAAVAAGAALADWIRTGTGQPPLPGPRHHPATGTCVTRDVEGRPE